MNTLKYQKINELRSLSKIRIKLERKRKQELGNIMVSGSTKLIFKE